MSLIPAKVQMPSSTPLTARDLDPDQQAAVTRLIEYDETLLIAGMGAGKTVIALTAVEELLAIDVLHHVLVVAPLAVCTDAWALEPKRWSHLRGLDIAYATRTGPKRRLAVERRAQITVINFENLRWLAVNFDLANLYDGLIIDESTKLAETGGQTFKAFRRFIPKIPWRVCMSGTPVVEGLDKLFGQMLIVDAGKTLGRNKQKFLDEYFYPTDYERRQWAPRESAIPIVANQVKGWVHEVPDYRHTLPPLTVEPLFVPITNEQRAASAELAKNNIWMDVEAVNEAVLTNKLLQMASGFVYAGDYEKGNRVSHAIRCRKWRIMSNHIAQYRDDGRNLIIPYWWDVQKQWLRDMHLPLYRPDLKDKWNRGEISVMGIHPRSCGHGLNLQYGGSDILWFGPQWSLDMHQQVISRIWRRGQTEPVNCKVLITVDSADEAAWDRLQGKADWAERWSAQLERIKRYG